mmetsp:Transcript_51231/g.120380  ORF Transcript_51231/g.120380 Transcript_51231/m.120380 type:complete len:86 (+) Transcript_51231:628-885(+)
MRDWRRNSRISSNNAGQLVRASLRGLKRREGSLRQKELLRGTERDSEGGRLVIEPCGVTQAQAQARQHASSRTDGDNSNDTDGKQ